MNFSKILGLDIYIRLSVFNNFKLTEFKIVQSFNFTKKWTHFMSYQQALVNSTQTVYYMYSSQTIKISKLLLFSTMLVLVLRTEIDL